MAPKPNADVQKKLEELREAFLKGVADGIDSDFNFLPEFECTKVVKDLTAYERGYFLGQQIKIHDYLGGIYEY